MMKLLKEKDFAFFEELYSVDTDWLTRYADIVAFPKKGKSALILDTTVRYEMNNFDQEVR